MEKMIRGILNYLLNFIEKYIKWAEALDEIITDHRDKEYKLGEQHYSMPSSFEVVDKKFVNQKVRGYKMSCTAQCVSIASNNSGKIWGVNNKYSGFILFDLMVEKLLASRTKGAYLIHAIKEAYKLSWFHAYYSCSNLQAIKAALYDGCNVVTGSVKIDWKECRYDGLVKTISKGSGHAFTIVWWDDDKVIEGYVGALKIENSYWNTYAGTGYFYVPYALINKGILFNTKKALVVNRRALIK